MFEYTSTWYGSYFFHHFSQTAQYRNDTKGINAIFAAMASIFMENQNCFF